MDIEIRARNLKLTDAQRDLTEKRIGAALDRFEARLRRVLVVLEDLNGPKGGADTRCKVRVTGLRGLGVQAQATDISVAAAVDRACDAIGRNVAKAFERAKDFTARDRTSLAGERRARG